MADRKSDFALPTLDDLFSTQEERDDARLEKIRDIPLDLIDKPYTLEEVDTAIRYVVPKSQTAPITWDKATKREFTNILK